MSRLWLALIALLSALSPPPVAAPGGPPPAEHQAESDDDDDDDATSHRTAGDARSRLARAGLEVEDRIARRRLSPERAAATRAAFAGRLLWNLSTVRAQGAVSSEEERHVRSFARWMLDRKA